MSADEYYAIQDQPSFRSLFASVMDLELEILDVWEEDGAKCERVRNRPNYEKWVPKIGRKFVKPDDIAFIDETVYAPHSQTKPPYKMKIDSLLPLLGDRVQIKRVVVISAVDETHCRHTITGEVNVRVVGVGKLVEKYVMQNTISALELLDSVVARYKKVRESVKVDEAPAELSEDLQHVLQEPYQYGHVEEPEEVSAQTAYAAEESDAEDSALSHPAPLTRASTRFYDAEEHPWEKAMDIEKYLQSTEEEMEEDEEREGGTEEDAALGKSASKKHPHIGDHNLRERMRSRRHANREKRQRRNERTKEFFEGLGQSMRRRREDAIKSGQADLLNSRGEKDEVLKWNEDMQRWERVWKSSHTASIPRAIDKIFGPLTKAVERIKASREGRSDSEESAPEEAAPETLHSKSAKFFSKMSISKQREAKGK
ncbi:g2221 [Coccomyxa viridis]|uniref:G2221 protein n=1 Tax=Coccomyxa viridis TaxID=1274662 RepID=A0ABP1FRT9_9CHLO